MASGAGFFDGASRSACRTLYRSSEAVAGPDQMRPARWAIFAGCSGASKGGSSPCSLRCAWLRSRFAPLTQPALPAIRDAGRLQGMVLSVSPRNGWFVARYCTRAFGPP